MSAHISAAQYRVRGEMWRLFISFSLLLIITWLFFSIDVFWALVLIIGAVLYVQIEQASYLGNAVRVHRKQFPEMYEIFHAFASRLGVKRANLYIVQDPNLQAHAIGITTCSVVITSGLVESLSEEELAFVIAHELGHYHAGHTRVTSLFVPVNFGNMFSSLIFGLWQRHTEYTADRCGMLLTNDLDSGIDTMLKLAVGKELAKKMDFSGYLQQMKKANTFTVKLSELFTSHPLFTNRIKAVVQYWREVHHEM